MQAQKDLFGGGSGGGVNVIPVGFLTIQEGNVRLLQLDPFNSSVDRIIGMAPGFMDAITNLLNQNKKQKDAEKAAAAVEAAEAAKAAQAEKTEE